MRFTVRTQVAYTLACSLLLAGEVFSPRFLSGADPAAPSVDVTVTAADDLLADGKFLLSLTNETEQKQWQVLKDYVEVFLIGVDTKLPTRVDVLYDDKGSNYVWSVPVSNFTKFKKQNLSLLTSRVRQNAPNLYQLGTGRSADFNGMLKLDTPYAHIAEDPTSNAAGIADATAAVNGVPADPRIAAQPLINRGFAIAINITNKQTDAASQTKRREMFKPTRTKSAAAMKKLKGESTADFDFRKKALDVQMGELEWFFAESKQALLGMTIDRTKALGRIDIELQPIADSALAKAVALLQTKASYFANVEKSSSPILDARINHPLDDMRKKSATALAVLLGDFMRTQAGNATKLSAEEKTASQQLIDKTVELIQGGIDAGFADGFIDVHKGAAGKNVLLAGIRAADGTKVTEILSLVPKARAGESVKLDVAEESGVKIHSIAFSKEKFPFWNNFLGAESMYVGSSKDAIWCASGEGALEALKAAIKKTTQPAPAGAENAPWAELTVHLKPWMAEAAADVPKTKGEGNYRKIVQSAFDAADDLLSARMTRDKDGKIVGEIVAQKSLLRFAGKIAADFSKENLDESKPKDANKKQPPRSAKN